MGSEDGSVLSKFDGTDYSFWKMQIEDYFNGKNLHQPLKKRPETMNQNEWNLFDRQILGVMVNTTKECRTKHRKREVYRGVDKSSFGYV